MRLANECNKFLGDSLPFAVFVRDGLVTSKGNTSAYGDGAPACKFPAPHIEFPASGEALGQLADRILAFSASAEKTIRL